MAPMVAAAAGTALPYVDEVEPVKDRRYHIGLVLTGLRHVGGPGLGMILGYGRLQRGSFPINGGGEFLFLSSGERRVRREEAHNTHFAADSLYATVSYVYETASMVGFGGTAYHVVREPPEELGLVIPGIAVGLTAGVMFETDRVGLRSSEYDVYYGYGNSDTNISLRPYVRQRILFTQGRLSLTAGFTIVPIFPTWHVGLTFGW